MVRPKSGIPRGYQAVMPYLRVRDAHSAIKFYKKAFGAKENFRLKMRDGKLGHAELDIGGAIIMLSEEFPDHQAVGPKTLKGTSVAFLLYVPDTDKAVAKAVRAGARLRRPVEDQFYGDRTGQVEDPFGHVWFIQTRIEKVAPKDMQKRLNAMERSAATAKTGAAKSATNRKPAVRAPKAAAKSPRRKSAST